MNIFCTNDDPILSANDLCDQHVRSKMQIEGAIMLAHAFDQEVIEWCGANVHNTSISSDKKGKTPFAIAISDNCECRKSSNFNSLTTIEQYREYIRKDKPFATWTNRKNPSWY